MSNIDKQAVTAKTKELASFMVERFSMNPVSCKLLNEAWKKEFPDEVAIAERMLALLDELEHYKSREERVIKLVLDNSTSWDALYKKLEAAEKRIAEQREYYEGVIADGSKRIAELESKNGYLRTIAHEQNELDIRASLDSNNTTVEMGRLHKRIAELEAKLANPVLLPKTNGYWNEQEKAYEEAITLAKRQVRLAGFSVEGDE
ncbi:hypothetical protein G208_19053 [Salmonella enterica subsp. enterica serovar Newport str. Henan_3]|nr:hypothetical protein G208_19053 [Salmonella enterica subsp. enterica serovar Newport str. Henan_3]